MFPLYAGPLQESVVLVVLLLEILLRKRMWWLLTRQDQPWLIQGVKQLNWYAPKSSFWWQFFQLDYHNSNWSTSRSTCSL
jgi:hypothetical protein